jgi:hypothetical protein
VTRAELLERMECEQYEPMPPAPPRQETVNALAELIALIREALGD